MSHSVSDQNELIFYNNQNLIGTRLLPAQLSDKHDLNTRVDLEIIFLGPQRRPSDHNQKQRRLIDRPAADGSRLDKSIVLGSSSAEKNNDDYVTNDRKLLPRDARLPTISESDDNEPANSITDDNNQTVGSRQTKSSKNDGLLNQLERRYRENGVDGMVSDDDTYVDYMDYF